METIIQIPLSGDTSYSDQHAVKLLLADSLRAFIASRSGDYVIRRYASERHKAAFLKTKQELTNQRLRIAQRLLDNIWNTTVEVFVGTNSPPENPELAGTSSTARSQAEGTNPMTDPTMLPANATVVTTPLIKIVYTLSEAGRRESLLHGGNGRQFQFILVVATKELLDLATINVTGEAFIFLNPNIPNDVDILGTLHGWSLCKMTQTPTCPRRKAIVECFNFHHDAKLVPLDYESPATMAHSFDYDIPFTAESIVNYILTLSQCHTTMLESAKAIATQKNEEDAMFRRRQQRLGGAKLSEWLTHQELQGTIGNGLPDGSCYVTLEQPGDESSPSATGKPLTVLLDSTDLHVFTTERDRRRETAQALQAEKLRLLNDERNVWIRNLGSRRLRAGLETGFIDTMKTAYEEERIAHDIGPEWIALHKLRPGIKERDVLNPQEDHLEDLHKAQQSWPQCNARIRSTRSLNASENTDWRVTIMMETPWNQDLTIVRFLTDEDE